MKYASIRTLAVTAALAAWPVFTAEAQTPAPPPSSPLIESGMQEALFQAITNGAPRAIETTRAAEVPLYVSMLLGRFTRRLADADQPYGGPDTPAAGDENQPTERLVWAARIDDYYIVNWESNGAYVGADTHAFRIEPTGKARVLWHARLARLPGGPDGKMNPYRSFADFTEALKEGDISGSTGRCFNMMLAPPAAVTVMLRRRTGPAVTEIAALPAPVQEAVRFTQGSTIKWAVPVGDYYVVDASKDSGEVISVIRNPPSSPTKPLWKGQVAKFARFEEFQEALRNSMSPESEAEIRAGRCLASARPAPAPAKK